MFIEYPKKLLGYGFYKLAFDIHTIYI